MTFGLAGTARKAVAIPAQHAIDLRVVDEMSGADHVPFFSYL
jgi:hypothetical protein